MAKNNTKAMWIHAMPRYHLTPTLNHPQYIGLVDEIDEDRTIEAPPIGQESASQVETEIPMANDPTQVGVLPVETELPMSTRKTTRSGREVRTPQHLRDFVLLSKLSRQTYFAPSRNVPRVLCAVLNHQRLSSPRWDNLLTSLRSGSYASLLSFVQQHPEDGYLDE
jgi:hypothetical protein